MGCSASTGAKKSLRADNGSHLSEAQKYLIRETWETIELHQFSVGKGTFLRFFEANPEYQDLFPEFKNIRTVELYKTSALYGHGKRVLKAVEKAVLSLDDGNDFSTYLQELGGRHQARALKPIYLDAMQVAFIAALKELLQREWTSATEDAWNQLFRYISSTMVQGLLACAQ